MILGLLGFAAIVIFTIFVARTAGENGRSAVRWGLACVGVGIFFQLILPFLFGLVFAILVVLSGTPPEMVMRFLEPWLVTISVVTTALSFVGMFLVLRKVAALPVDDDPAAELPPPPPQFGS